MSQGRDKEVGAALRAYREAITGMDGKPLTVRQLATLSGLSHSDISRVERGEKPATPRHLLKLAKPLRISPLKLLLLGEYVDEQGEWSGDEPDQIPTPLPHDPLAAVTQALQQGPWPQNISAAVYALLAAAADDKRTLWERRFDEALARVEAEPPGAQVIVNVLDSAIEPSPELRRAIEEVVRTQRAVDGFRLRNALFASSGERR